jgi:hypothetical protein
MPPAVRVCTSAAGLACLATGVALLLGPDVVNDVWPWALTPLVARIIGVWTTALALAFAWAVWDGDAVRASPILGQAAPTAVLIGIVPLLHRDDLTHGVGHFALFTCLVASLGAAGAHSLVRALAHAFAH